MKCINKVGKNECGGNRFRTVSKAKKLYRCRTCDALYQDGSLITEAAPVVEPVVAELPVEPGIVPVPEVVEAREQSKPGFFSRLAAAVGLI